VSYNLYCKRRDVYGSSVLESKDVWYVLVQDHVFCTVSAAAIFITQRRSSGTSEWKDKNGI